MDTVISIIERNPEVFSTKDVLVQGYKPENLRKWSSKNSILTNLKLKIVYDVLQ